MGSVSSKSALILIKCTQLVHLVFLGVPNKLIQIDSVLSTSALTLTHCSNKCKEFDSVLSTCEFGITRLGVRNYRTKFDFSFSSSAFSVTRCTYRDSSTRFWPLVFFINRSHLGPCSITKSGFEFTEIFEFEVHSFWPSAISWCSSPRSTRFSQLVYSVWPGTLH